MAEPTRNASPWQVAKAVFWSFLGIRRRSHHEQDAVRIRPAQAVIAGLVGAGVFVLTLVLIVRYVVGHAG